MGVRRLAVGPSTLGLPTVGFIPCRCGRDSVSGTESPARAHRAARCRAPPRTSARRPRGRGRRRSCRGVGPFRRRGGIGSGGVVARSRAWPAADGGRRRAGARHRHARGRRRRRSSRRRLRPGVPAGARRAGRVRARLAGAGHSGRCGRRAVARRDCRAGACAPSQRQCRAHARSRRHRHAQRGGPVTAVRSPLDAWPGPPDGPAPRPPCRSAPLFRCRLAPVNAPAPRAGVAEDSTPGPWGAFSRVRGWGPGHPSRPPVARPASPTIASASSGRWGRSSCPEHQTGRVDGAGGRRSRVARPTIPRVNAWPGRRAQPSLAPAIRTRSTRRWE
jgi:hypothetical protein